MGVTPQELPAAQVSTPAINAKAITPANADLEYYTRGIIVGGSGNLVIRVPGDLGDLGDVTIPVLAGQILPVVAKQIRLTGTTATGIIALF